MIRAAESWTNSSLWWDLCGRTKELEVTIINRGSSQQLEVEEKSGGVGCEGRAEAIHVASMEASSHTGDVLVELTLSSLLC